MNEKEIRELEQKLKTAREEKTKVIVSKLKEYSLYIIVIIISIWWVFYNAIKIEQADLEIKDIALLTVANIVMGLALTSLIAENGFKKARRTEEYISAKEEYYKAQRDGIKYQREIQEYAYQTAFENIVKIRKSNLEANFIKYEDIFDENDIVRKDIDLKKYSRQQRKIIRKCLKMKVYLPKIFGNFSSTFFGVKKEISKKEYEARYTTKSFIIKVLLSFFSASVVFTYIGLTWDAVLYALFQLAIWGGSGVMQLTKNYNFIIETELQQIVEKTFIIKSYLERNENKGVIENGTGLQENV